MYKLSTIGQKTINFLHFVDYPYVNSQLVHSKFIASYDFLEWPHDSEIVVLDQKIFKNSSPNLFEIISFNIKLP